MYLCQKVRNVRRRLVQLCHLCDMFVTMQLLPFSSVTKLTLHEQVANSVWNAVRVYRSQGQMAPCDTSLKAAPLESSSHLSDLRSTSARDWDWGNRGASSKTFPILPQWGAQNYKLPGHPSKIKRIQYTISALDNAGEVFVQPLPTITFVRTFRLAAFSFFSFSLVGDVLHFHFILQTFVNV